MDFIIEAGKVLATGVLVMVVAFIRLSLVKNDGNVEGVTNE